MLTDPFHRNSLQALPPHLALRPALSSVQMEIDRHWDLTDRSGLPRETIEDFLEPAVDAVPASILARVGDCSISIVRELDDPTLSSAWTDEDTRVEITLAGADADPHNLALELLFCVGQALWERLLPGEEAGWLRLLDEEIRSEIGGEIDEETVAAKERLLSSPALAGDANALFEYAADSFASTAAEFIHALWHDVTLRSGPEHLPPEALRRRFELLARWFPLDPGQELFGN